MANTTRRSIELEPKTLDQGQLSQARKVAADVVQKMEPKEASPLLTEMKGLEHLAEEVKEADEEEEEEKDVEKQVGCIEDKIEIIEEKACNLSFMADSPSDHIHQREPLSAPF